MLAVLVVVGTGAQVVSADTGDSAYRQAVQQAYDIIQNASAPDATPAQQAAGVLRAGTGNTQPEIVADLTMRPPGYEDARARLRALLDALGRPASTQDPALARQRLHDVMSMSRYDALHRPPTLLERFSQWVNDRLNDLLRFLFGGRGPGSAVSDWFWFVLGVIALAAIAAVVFRAARGRPSDTALAPAGGPRPAADYFADADRHAARGDYVRAIRSLCAGVAAALAGERTWEGSPLTVREIFNRAADGAKLAPLLVPFEAAVYGGRSVDRATYERAAQAAARYRQPAEVAA